MEKMSVLLWFLYYKYYEYYYKYIYFALLNTQLIFFIYCLLLSIGIYSTRVIIHNEILYKSKQYQEAYDNRENTFEIAFVALSSMKWDCIRCTILVSRMLRERKCAQIETEKNPFLLLLFPTQFKILLQVNKAKLALRVSNVYKFRETP